MCVQPTTLIEGPPGAYGVLHVPNAVTFHQPNLSLQQLAVVACKGQPQYICPVHPGSNVLRRKQKQPQCYIVTSRIQSTEKPAKAQQKQAPHRGRHALR